MSLPAVREGDLRMTLVQMFPPTVWIPDLKAREKKLAIRELIQHLVSAGVIQEDAAKRAEKAVARREGQGSTAIGKGLAIPHSKECAFLKKPVGAFARSREGLPFDAVDGASVHVIFLVISPASLAGEHVEILRRIARLHSDEKTLRFLAQSPTLDKLSEIFKEVDDSFH